MGKKGEKRPKWEKWTEQGKIARNGGKWPKMGKMGSEVGEKRRELRKKGEEMGE